MAEHKEHHEPGTDESFSGRGLFNDGQERDAEPFEAPAGLPTSPEFLSEENYPEFNSIPMVDETGCVDPRESYVFMELLGALRERVYTDPNVIPSHTAEGKEIR